MVITDSAGITSKIEWIKKLSNYIGASKLKNSTVYSLGFKRQTDGISCPTISILDILESSKSNIFDFVEKLVIEKPKSVISTPMSGLNNFFLINEYPPSFMKVTQSLSAINTYNETYPEYRDIDLTGNNENLKKVIASQTEKGWVDISGSLVLKDVNFYTRKKGFEYMNTVVQHILEGQER
jgi:UDP-glucose 6-dehydrogenase